MNAERIVKDKIHDLSQGLTKVNLHGNPKTIETLGFLQLINDQQYLADWVEYKFILTVNNLFRDINIFLLTNTISLTLALLSVYIKKNSTLVVKLSWVVIASTLLSSLIYVFNQNWFYNILFNNYLGYTYSIIQLIITAILADVTFNRGAILSIFGEFSIE